MEESKVRSYSIKIGKLSVDVPLDTDTCILCVNKLHTAALGECGHKAVCYFCVLRLRWVMGRTACSICKVDSGTVYVTSDLSANYEDFPREGKPLIRDYSDQNVLFEDKSTYEYMVRMRSYCCLVKGCNKQMFDKKALEGHMKTQHNRILCHICFKNRPVFIGEQFIYSNQTFNDHIKYGEYYSDLMIKPHPCCSFCNENFYTEEPLLDHLSKCHMSCHLCGEKAKYVYYKDYMDLETHFQKSHYLCANEQCKTKCFVVFGTLEELHLHNHKEHGTSAPGKGLKLDALKVGLFSFEPQPMKKSNDDRVGTDFSHYFSNEYYSRVKEEYERKMKGRKEETKRGKYGRRQHNEGKHHSNFNKGQSKCSKKECLTNLRNELHEITKSKIATSEIKEGECNVEKEQLYQLFGLIDNMNLDNILQCEYLMNFGVSLSIKKHLNVLLSNNNGHVIDEDEIFALSLRELLIIYKYLDTAIQKLEGKYIKRELADINPNLLHEFTEVPKKPNVKEKQVDYKSALKNHINLDNKEDFPELEHVSKEQANQPGVWDALPGAKPKKNIKPKIYKPMSYKNVDEEFPPLPTVEPKVIKQPIPQIPSVVEVKKTMDNENEGLIAHIKVRDNQQAKPKGKKERKKKKQGKEEVDIQIGFH